VYARKQFDLSFRDLWAGLSFCLRPSWKRARLVTELGQLWSDHDDAAAALSVRSAFDAWLTVLALPRGSEVIASGINIPDMARILEHHGLKIVPVDLDLQTLELHPDELREAITPKTRLVLVAHLFGARMNLDPIFEITEQHPNILVAEDCAQTFTGLDEYRGDDRSNLSLFSFGAIKTATALGGAMCRIRDRAQREALRAKLAHYPAQTTRYFAKRVLKYTFLKMLSQRHVYGAFFSACQWFGVDFDQLTVSVVRGFKGENLIPLLRHQPTMAQLTLLRRRLRQYRRTHLDRRCQAGNHLNQNLPPSLRSAGFRNPHHTWWLFPVCVENQNALVEQLRAAGFDATASSTQLCALTGEHGPAPECASFMDGTVYLPIHANMSHPTLDRMAEITRNHGITHEPASVEETELTPVPLGK
jgi:perosamine synthetase